jgi:hypothetical protein
MQNTNFEYSLPNSILPQNKSIDSYWQVSYAISGIGQTPMTDSRIFLTVIRKFTACRAGYIKGHGLALKGRSSMWAFVDLRCHPANGSKPGFHPGPGRRSHAMHIFQVRSASHGRAIRKKPLVLPAKQN